MNYHQILNLCIRFLSIRMFFFYLFARKEAYLYVVYLRFLTQIKMTSKITAFFKKSRAYQNFYQQRNWLLQLLKIAHLLTVHLDLNFYLLKRVSLLIVPLSQNTKCFKPPRTKCFKPVRTNCFTNCLFVSLSVINVHSDIAHKLSLSNLIELFASKKERKLEFFVIC